MGNWIKPIEFNQPGFDLARLERLNENEYLLHTYQITTAKSHDLNLNHFYEYAHFLTGQIQRFDEKICIKAISITFIIPSNKLEFSMGTIQLSNKIAAFKVGKSQENWINNENLIKEKFVQVKSFLPNQRVF